MFLYRVFFIRKNILDIFSKMLSTRARPSKIKIETGSETFKVNLIRKETISANSNRCGTLYYK